MLADAMPWNKKTKFMDTTLSNIRRGDLSDGITILL